MDLESALKKAAYKIWKEMAPVRNTADINIFQVREEGLTSMMLKKLANSECDQITRMLMIGGTLENVRGYDLELCIGSEINGEYVRYLIQAKRLYGSSLNSRYTTTNNQQITTLQNYAKRPDVNAIPLFALYNHLEVNGSTLEGYYNSITMFDKKAMGITLTTTTKMNIDHSFEAIHNANRPYFRYPLYRYHPNDLFFYNDNMQTGVPFHELAYFTIAKAKEYNRIHLANQAQNVAGFFFFFGKFLFGEGDDLIPILKNTNKEELTTSFRNRYEQNSNSPFNPGTLIIMDTNEGKE